MYIIYIISINKLCVKYSVSNTKTLVMASVQSGGVNNKMCTVRL